MQKGYLNMMRYVNHVKSSQKSAMVNSQRRNDPMNCLTLKHGQSARYPAKSYTLLASERR